MMSCCHPRTSTSRHITKMFLMMSTRPNQKVRASEKKSGVLKETPKVQRMFRMSKRKSECLTEILSFQKETPNVCMMSQWHHDLKGYTDLLNDVTKESLFVWQKLRISVRKSEAPTETLCFRNCIRQCQRIQISNVLNSNQPKYKPTIQIWVSFKKKEPICILAASSFCSPLILLLFFCCSL